MLTKFWEGVGGALADRWSGAVGPAIVFWTGGVLAWSVRSGRSPWAELATATEWLNGQDVASQVLLLAAGLGVVGGSAVVVDRLAEPVLRLLEGYWPSFVAGLAARYRGRAHSNHRRDLDEWQAVQSRLADRSPTADDLREHALLESRIRHRPSQEHLFLPTRIGNTLRAAETRPHDRYGLELTTIWPRLWLVMPEEARAELGQARSSLDRSVAVVIWALAFVAFTPLAWWALPVGVAVALVAVKWWVPRRAEVFGELLVAAVDLHRTKLYQQLRWPLPTNPRQERTSGVELTRYLLRGSDSAEPVFAEAPADDDKQA